MRPFDAASVRLISAWLARTVIVLASWKTMSPATMPAGDVGPVPSVPFLDLEGESMSPAPESTSETVMPLSQALTASSPVPIVPPSELTGASFGRAMLIVTWPPSMLLKAVTVPWPPPGAPSSMT